MHDVTVIERSAEAQVVLDPMRRQILHCLATPGSASSIANELDLPRQKVNYHLRLLEDHGFVELVETRPRRGLTERVMVATAASYVVSAEALGECRPDMTTIDQLSSGYLIALGARLVSEVGALAKQAQAANKPLATLSLDAEVTFATPTDRQAFTAELAETITKLVGKYHNEDSSNGRPHRLVVGAHPIGKEARSHD